MFSFQHQNSHNAQHHANIQQDHNAHTANGSVLGHHPSYSGGTPSFTPQSLQNGHAGAARGGQAQHNEHFQEVQAMHKASQESHKSMIENLAPHHFARIKSGENRYTVSAPTALTSSQSEDTEDRGRPSNLDGSSYPRRQDWTSVDVSGQGLRVLAPPLFHYTFLTELYVASNKITTLPGSIGLLRALRFLDVSNNLLKDLPPELGMCVYLKNLLLFDNRLSILPHELGSLHQLEILGIEGNLDIDQSQRTTIVEKGTKALIHELRENAPGKLPPCSFDSH
jgi:CCR4-NOT transcription complex subunit 6